jgi:hypothetical protein
MNGLIRLWVFAKSYSPALAISLTCRIFGLIIESDGNLRIAEGIPVSTYISGALVERAATRAFD